MVSPSIHTISSGSKRIFASQTIPLTVIRPAAISLFVSLLEQKPVSLIYLSILNNDPTFHLILILILASIHKKTPDFNDQNQMLTFRNN